MALGSRDLLPRRMETARSWEAGGRGACGGEAGRAEHEARDRWREGTDGLMASASLFEDPLSNGSGPASLVSSIAFIREKPGGREHAPHAGEGLPDHGSAAGGRASSGRTRGGRPGSLIHAGTKRLVAGHRGRCRTVGAGRPCSRSGATFVPGRSSRSSAANAAQTTLHQRVRKAGRPRRHRLPGRWPGDRCERPFTTVDTWCGRGYRGHIRP